MHTKMNNNNEDGFEIYSLCRGLDFSIDPNQWYPIYRHEQQIHDCLLLCPMEAIDKFLRLVSKDVPHCAVVVVRIDC